MLKFQGVLVLCGDGDIYVIFEGMAAYLQPEVADEIGKVL